MQEPEYPGSFFLWKALSQYLTENRSLSMYKWSVLNEGVSLANPKETSVYNGCVTYKKSVIYWDTALWK